MPPRSRQPAEGNPLPIQVDQTTAQEQSPRRGGAFGGALKRRIELTDSVEKFAATNVNDVQLLTPDSLYDALHPTGEVELAYAGILFPPEEYAALTIYPEALAKRVGARVLSGTHDRPADARQSRKTEAVQGALQARIEHARDVLERYDQNKTDLEALLHESQSPGYAHMTQKQMDGLMRRCEDIFITMFDAIVSSKGLGTKRTESLTAALEYILSADDYKRTFNAWVGMSELALSWTKAKARRFQYIEHATGQSLRRSS